MQRADLATCRLEIEFTLKPGKRREFVRSFEELNCLEGKGHIKNTVYEDRDEPGHMIWVAVWTSRNALDVFVHSDQFRVLIGGLKVLSSGTSCRLVDGGRPVMPGSALAGRVEGESQDVPIDLSEFEGPRQ